MLDYYWICDCTEYVVNPLSVDFRFDAVCHPLLDDQLGYGVLQQAPRYGLPQASHPLLPWQIPEQDVLLQDLQLGQPHLEPRPAPDARPRQVVSGTRIAVLELHEARARHNTVLAQTGGAGWLRGTATGLRVVLLLWHNHQVHITTIWKTYCYWTEDGGRI